MHNRSLQLGEGERERETVKEAFDLFEIGLIEEVNSLSVEIYFNYQIVYKLRGPTIPDLLSAD